MACLYRSDLSKNLTSVLVQDAEDAKKIGKSISDFKENAKANLKGDAYNAGIDQLTIFIDAMNKRAQVMDTLVVAINDAMSSLNDYMGEYDVLDDGKLGELRETIARTEVFINDIRGKLYTLNLNYKEGIDDPKNKKLLNYDALNILKEQEALLQKFKIYEDKLENLAPTVETAYNKFVGSVNSTLSSYESMVNNISIAEVIETV